VPTFRVSGSSRVEKDERRRSPERFRRVQRNSTKSPEPRARSRSGNLAIPIFFAYAVGTPMGNQNRGRLDRVFAQQGAGLASQDRLPAPGPAR
jgi:hypothetical protein